MASNIFMWPLLIFAHLASGTLCRAIDADPDQVSRVEEALWEADYKIMSLVVAKKLSEINETYCGSLPEGQHGNPHFTIFVPRDDAIYPHVNFEYQIVTRKVERDEFASSNLPKGSKLRTCFRASNVTVTRSSVEDNIVRGAINRVIVTDWNIYDDGYLTVHGVEDFFDVRWTIMDEDYHYICKTWYREEAQLTRLPVLVNVLCPPSRRASIDEHSEQKYEYKRYRRNSNAWWLKYPAQRHQRDEGF